MATASTSTPNLSSTSLPGMTGGMATTTTALSTVGLTGLPVVSSVFGPPSLNLPSQVAQLTLDSTTITAYAIPSTTGLAVLPDGQTLTFRAEGVTLSDGEVVSLGNDGLVVSTTTGTFSEMPATFTLSSGFELPTAPGPVLTNGTYPALGNSTMSSTMTTTNESETSSGTLTTSTSMMDGESGTGSSGSDASETQASASPSTSPDAAAGLSAGKAAVLLGAVGGAIALGL